MKSTNAKKETSAEHKPGSTFFGKSSQGSLWSGGGQPFFGQQLVQPKLFIGQPNDKYEQEADAVAEMVVQQLSKPETIQTKPLAPTISPLIQPKCAKCEEEGKLQRKEEDEDLLNPKVLRKCAECEKGKKLQAKPNSTGSHQSPGIQNNLAASKGSGNPLPAPTKAKMESSFSADFSGVRIHNDSTSVQMNKELNAQAFTHGKDIYFNTGKYDPDSNSGKQLLAHELTHVVQQNITSKGAIQKQDSPEPTLDQPEEKQAWDPEVVLEEYLQEFEAEKEAENASDAWAPVEPSDEGPTAWMGSGPTGLRKNILIYAELQKLSANQNYKSEIINLFKDKEDPADDYLKSVKSKIDSVAGSEESSLALINSLMNLGATPENFIDIEWFQSLDGANAFPDYAWEIVVKLISPSQYLNDEINNNFNMSKRFYESTWAMLENDLFQNGLPVSYAPSLNLTYYRFIRSQALSKFIKDLPDQKWMVEKFLAPGETELHTEVMKQCLTSFAYYGVSSLNLNILNKWKEASVFKWMSYDTRAISHFRKDYQNGFVYLDEFYKFEYKGVAYSLGEMAIAIILGLVGINGQSPYKVLALKSHSSRVEAPQIISLFVETAQNDFSKRVALADGMINGLTGNEKLLRSVEWSLSKGFAGDSINVLLDNLDTILLDILKEWAKEKAIKKGIISGVGWLGGPFVKLGTWLYNAYDAYQDTQDLIEITELVNKLMGVMNEARTSKSVIQSQRSAARLAEATVTTVPLLLQILGTKVLSKLSKGLPKDKGDVQSAAKREKLLDESSKENDVNKLTGEQLDAEISAASKSKIYKASKNDKEYDVVVVLSNGHQWKRNKHGIWCRHSDECLIPSANSKFIQDLNNQADSSNVRKETIEEYEQRGGNVTKLDPGKVPEKLPSESVEVSPPKPPGRFEDIDVPTRTEKQAGVKVGEDHHVLTRFRTENQNLFKKIGFDVDDDFNLIKNFKEHGEMRGWYKWVPDKGNPKGGKYIKQRNGHHPDYNTWATEKVKSAIKGLRGKKRQAAFQSAVEEIAAIVEKNPDILAYGPKIFENAKTSK